MGIRHYIENEVEAESNKFYEKNYIREIIQSVMTGVTYNKPENPLLYMEECLAKIRTNEIPVKIVRWNTFLPSAGTKYAVLPPPDAIVRRNSAAQPLPSIQRNSPQVHPGKHLVMAQQTVLPPIQDVKAPIVGHPNIVFVLGGPGSGKGTQCERLAKEFKLTHLSTGDLLREQVELQTPVGIQAAALMKEGKMVPMSIMINLLKDQIDQNMDSPGFLIDGFPRAMDQALEFEKTIGTCKTVIAFRCSLSVLEARLLERGKTSGRADDNIETIKKRFNTFENQSMPVIEHFKLLGKCIEISSEQAIEQVYQEASAVFSKAIFEGENIVFVLGGPGSGKGTQCDEIVSKLGWAHLSTGDLLRAEVKKGTDLGKSLEADMKEGKMISVEITIELLKKGMTELRGAPGYLIDGFPRTMQQAHLFEKHLGKCSFVLYFEASDTVLTDRLMIRGKTSGRADDNAESIKKRLVTFHEASMPVIDYYHESGRTRKVNSERLVANVTQDTLALFSEFQ